MGISPLLRIRQMLGLRSSRDVSVGYFAILLVGFGPWISYDIVARNPVLIVPNAVALLIGVITIVIALHLRSPAGRR
jgi:MtN3 and saliva related transmembrane protein